MYRYLLLSLTFLFLLSIGANVDAKDNNIEVQDFSYEILDNRYVHLKFTPPSNENFEMVKIYRKKI